jgi:hypothetical protein
VPCLQLALGTQLLRGPDGFPWLLLLLPLRRPKLLLWMPPLLVVLLVMLLVMLLLLLLLRRRPKLLLWMPPLLVVLLVTLLLGLLLPSPLRRRADALVRLDLGRQQLLRRPQLRLKLAVALRAGRRACQSERPAGRKGAAGSRSYAACAGTRRSKGRCARVCAEGSGAAPALPRCSQPFQPRQLPRPRGHPRPPSPLPELGGAGRPLCMPASAASACHADQRPLPAQPPEARLPPSGRRRP